VLTYRATLDVPIDTVARVSRWIQAHRARVDARPWQRAATCWTQAVLVLRWLKNGTSVDLLARDARISQATAYRYLHEAIDVIAEHAPDLTERIPGLDLRGRTRLHPRRHLRPRPRVAGALPGRSGRAPDPDRQGYAGAGIGIEVPIRGATCPSTTAPGTSSSPRYARPPNAPTRC